MITAPSEWFGKYPIEPHSLCLIAPLGEIIRMDEFLDWKGMLSGFEVLSQA